MRQRRTRALGAGALALATAVAGLGAAGGAAAATKPPPTKAPTVPLQLLSFNDYHGHLAPPTGNDGNLLAADGSTIPAGGVEYLTTHLTQLREGHREHADGGGRRPDRRLAVPLRPLQGRAERRVAQHAGAGRLERRQPRVRRGRPELLRMRYGGCHPTEGCFDDDGYSGTAFQYLAANVTYKDGVKATRPAGVKGYGSWFSAPTGRTVLPPTAVKTVKGVKVGFIGMTLEGTPELVAQAGIRDVNFHDEVETANTAANFLSKRGVKAIVVLLHEGGLPPTGAPFDYTCTDGSGLSGPIVRDRPGPVVEDRHGRDRPHAPAVHVHDRRPGRQPRWVTSASSFGRVITETELHPEPEDEGRGPRVGHQRQPRGHPRRGARPGADRDHRQVGRAVRADREPAGRQRDRRDPAEHQPRHGVVAGRPDRRRPARRHVRGGRRRRADGVHEPGRRPRRPHVRVQPGGRGRRRGDVRRGLHGPAVRQPARLDDAHGRPDRDDARAAVDDPARRLGPVPAPRALGGLRLLVLALRAGRVEGQPGVDHPGRRADRPGRDATA